MFCDVATLKHKRYMRSSAFQLLAAAHLHFSSRFAVSLIRAL
jgi:hypothetical protein